MRLIKKIISGNIFYCTSNQYLTDLNNAYANYVDKLNVRNYHQTIYGKLPSLVNNINLQVANQNLINAEVMYNNLRNKCY